MNTKARKVMIIGAGNGGMMAAATAADEAAADELAKLIVEKQSMPSAFSIG